MTSTRSSWASPVVVFLLVEGLLIWSVLRYRRKPTDTELPAQTHGNNLLEVVWTIIPALVVSGLFILTVDTLSKFDPVAAADDTPAPLTIDVTGFQWQWTFDYPDQGLSFTGTGRDGPVMVVPVNERVHIRLHSADVIHSFYVPQFLYKKDVIPGTVNEFDVVVQQVGTFSGQCAEFCGLGHADMHFSVAVDEPRGLRRVGGRGSRTRLKLPAPSQAAGAPTVTLTAISVIDGFQQKELSVPANQPWSIELDNSDPSVPHNFAIRGANPDGSDWIGDLFANGGETAVYQPPQLAPGDYQFFCSIHPNMTGTLHVGQ